MSNIGLGTTGQLVQATATNTSFLTTGSAGQVLSVAGGVPAWVNLSTVLNYISAVLVATTATLNATYLNGVAGVGATLVNAGTLAAFSVDGQTPAINSRVLVKNQSSTFQNGIYTLTTVGTGAVAWILTRSTDYNTVAEINPGDIVPVQTGTINANTSWIQGSTVATIGTDPITFTQFSSAPISTTQYDVLVGGANNTVASVGPGSAGQYLQSAGNASNPAYSTATLPSTATSTGTILRSDGTNWAATTATYPATTTVSQILYSSSANVVAGLTTGNDGVLITSHTGVPSLLAGGTTGQVLTATTNSPPTWVAPATSGTVTSVSGTTNRISVATGTTTPVIDIDAAYVGQSSITTLGTVATGTWSATNIALNKGGTNASLTADNGAIPYSTSTAIALLASTATANKALMSGASGAPTWSTPTFPNASATSRKIIVSDGTNWTASTETYAVPGTSGNVLTSNGTNWTSAAPATSGTVTSVSGTTNQVSVATGTTTPVISLVGPYTPATYTAHGVLIGEGTSSIVALAAGSAGQVLQSGGASADPVYSTATFPSTATGTGKILIADGTNWVASTPTYPNTSGTAGKVLISDGTNNVYSTPTFPNASATSRKIIVSDGTNWVASTETYAVPGTSGNVLTSDGTNWTSAAASGGGLQSTTVTLTSAQIKALRATPITLVAAQGVGTVINVIAMRAKFAYGGSNVFVSASGTIDAFYGSLGTQANNSSLAANADIVASANRYSVKPMAISNGVLTGYENKAIVAQNTSATEITGNAANDNTFTITTIYYVTSV